MITIVCLILGLIGLSVVVKLMVQMNSKDAYLEKHQKMIQELEEQEEVNRNKN